MLRVVESNRFEELAAVLADALATVADPFAPALVAVDNRVVARWVQYAVATANGIAAGYERLFLDDLVAATLATDTLRALDKPRLEAVLSSALADEALLDEAVMREPREYLAADPAGPSRRRVQLASQVADRYWQYALSRPDWLDAWERGVSADLGAELGKVDEDMAAWQARLWRAAHDRFALSDAARATRAEGGAQGALFVPTPRLASERRRAGMAAPAGAPIFAIGFSYLPRAYLDTLAYLAEARDVLVLAMSPCAEYWGDVQRRSTRSSAPRSGRPVQPTGPTDPPALERWGSPGRDYLSSLAELSQGDIDDRFVDATPDASRATARDRWTFDTLVRASTESKEATADAGVHILACPSVAREVEIIGSEIVRLLADDPSLRANQIAVLLPPGATEPYLGQLPAVFGALGLPFHVVDVPAVGHGHVAEAAALLLQLPLGTFRRPELLGLMTHPSVQARHPHVDPADWVRWADDLGIVHGADSTDHAGTYLHDADHFHWEQGLRRLALGAFMAAGRSDSDTVARTADRTYLPLEVAVDEQPAAATFALLARSLIADARWLRAQRRTLTSWAEVLDALVDAYLGAPGAAGEAELARVRTELAGLAELDLDGRELDFREIQALALRRLGRVRGDRGEPLAHGVHVARLVPHRPLPFPIVFALGLGEEHFPAGDRPGPLDLRRTRKKGDVSPRERDRYAFLETVLAARDALYLSYVSREPVTGETRSPSAVIHELAEMLAPYLGLEPEATLARMRIEHPLHRFDPKYDDGGSLTRSAAPTRPRERDAARVRQVIEASADGGEQAVPVPRAIRRRFAAAETLGPVARALGIGLGRDLPPPSDDQPLVLRISALRKFIESAPQGWAAAVLRLEQDDVEDPTLRDEEPLTLGALERAVAARDAFTRYLAGMPLDVAFERTWGRLRLQGGAPVGVFGTAARTALEQQVATWARELELHGGRTQHFRVFGFGRKPDALAELLPPIALTVEASGVRRRVELIGTSEPWGESAGSLIVAPGTMKARHVLRAAMDHVALAAAGRFRFGSKHLILDKDGAHPARHERWEQDEARAYLTRLVTDLLGGGHDYLMSVEMSQSILDGKKMRVEDPKDGRPGSIGYGPMAPRDDLEAPSDVEAEAMAQRRLAPLVSRIKEDA
ncbi:MAG TPA: exodeoxyribonuclease V subunit gamma [Kofleriaceae bacterium]|nr:exodeoxyribonuclease V subunit gamma [Kofleriaceae bacterium]